MAQQITRQLGWLQWHLTDIEVMWEALKELADPVAGHGFRGQIMCAPAPDTNGANIFELNLNIDNAPIVVARVGQVLVLMAGLLESLSQEDYDKKYGGE
jgi:hypothetical protein